jgi:hypothetical protein
MHSTAKAIMMYCQDNDDKYPPRRSIWKNGKPYAEPMPNAEKTFQIAVIGDLNPMTLKQNWRGAGVVYGTGYMQNPSGLYCPGQVYWWFVRESYESEEKAFGTRTFAQNSGVIRSGLLWNAWGKRYNDGTVDMFGKNWDHAFRTLSSMDNDKPLIIDHAIFPWCVPVHVAQGVETPTFNVTFNDGHVTPYTADDTYVDVLILNWNQPNGGILTNWGDIPGPNNDWADAYYLLTRIK